MTAKAKLLVVLAGVVVAGVGSLVAASHEGKGARSSSAVSSAPVPSICAAADRRVVVDLAIRATNSESWDTRAARWASTGPPVGSNGWAFG